jgi:hypothetical protein
LIVLGTCAIANSETQARVSCAIGKVSSDREAGVNATLSEGIADDRPGILGRLLAINPVAVEKLFSGNSNIEIRS